MALSKEQIAPVKAYVQHGFHVKDVSGGQAIGDCPFCLKPGKFYVNTDSKAWDCKVCGASGGFQTFLQRIAEDSAKAFDGQKAKFLGQSRGIPWRVMARFGVGYNARNKSYTLPVYDVRGKTLSDLRIYTNGRLISTATCRTGLWNMQSVNSSSGTVWLCEGEWDGMAMADLLEALAREDDCVVALPGAGVFKPQWVPILKGRDVVALYDNDEPGRKGAGRCYNLLRGVARSVRFMHWPPGTPDRYDLRDLYKEDRDKPERIMESIERNLADTPQGMDKAEEAKVTSSVIVYEGAGVDADTVRDAYRKWLHIPDPDVIDVLFGTVIGNRLPGDPLWLFLVAPPGMTKTEYLQTFGDAKAIEVMSTLTAHTLVSGASLAGGVDPSLIPQLNERVLVIKDFTTILNMNQQAREEIFGILRDAYDGELTKHFGNGIVRQYHSKFGIIAGVTPAIEGVLTNEAALGERFMQWSMPSPDSITGHVQYLERAAGNVMKEEEMRAELRKMAIDCLDYDFSAHSVSIPSDIQSKVLYLSILVAMLRGTVPRDHYTKEVVGYPYIEMGTRLSKQFLKAMIGVCQFRRLDRATDSELRIVQRLARYTAPKRTSMFLERVHGMVRDASFTTSEAADMVGLPPSTVQRQAESMHLLGILTKDKEAGARTAWMFTEDVLHLVESSGIFEW